MFPVTCVHRCTLSTAHSKQNAHKWSQNNTAPATQLVPELFATLSKMKFSAEPTGDA